MGELIHVFQLFFVTMKLQNAQMRFLFFINKHFIKGTSRLLVCQSGLVTAT